MMRAMQLDRPGEPLRAGRAAAAGARPGRAAGRGRRLRHLPHRPPYRRRRHPRPAADRAGPRDRRPGRGAGRGRAGFASATGSASPGSAGPAAIAPIAATDRENLCDDPLFTGFTRDGGFATHVVADAALLPSHPRRVRRRRGGAFALRRPDRLALAASWPARRAALGLYGFGAAAHILAQVAHLAGPAGPRLHPPRRRGRRRPSPCRSAAPRRRVRTTAPPEPLDAAILFAPVGALVPEALRHVRKGGRVVCGGIHMSDIPAFPYADLWGERSILSVANLTRADGAEFLARRRPGPGEDEDDSLSARRRRTKRSTCCGRADLRARRCWCPEGE